MDFSCWNAEQEQKNPWWLEPNQHSLVSEFCQDTSLHGMKYISQPQRHLSERIFWAVVIFAALVVASILSFDAWDSYKNRNIIVTFEGMETTVDEIPFPAVTVCNMNKVRKSQAREIIEKYAATDMPDLDEEAKRLKNLNLLHHVCNVSSGFSKAFNFSLQEGTVSEANLMASISNQTVDNLYIDQFLRDTSQKCPQMIPICMWRNEAQNCTKLFRAVETEYGKCCTFNMVPQSLLFLGRKDDRDDADEIERWSSWNIEDDGMLIRDGPRGWRYPYRQRMAGKSFGLSFLLDPDLKEYFCTNSDSVGFRLTTHLPIDVPNVKDYGIAIAPNSEVFVNIKPRVMLADPSIQDYSVKKRQCYFPRDFPLRFHKYYTMSNCLDECIAEETYKHCHCVRYYMPRDNNQSLCGPANYSCVEEVKNGPSVHGRKSECARCLRPCGEIQYVLDATPTPMEQSNENWKYENGTFPSWRHSNVTIVHIFMGQQSTYARVRKELNDEVALVALSGGIMSLCLGFSGLSLVEFIYYFTFRAWFMRMWRRAFSVKLFKPSWILPQHGQRSPGRPSGSILPVVHPVHSTTEGSLEDSPYIQPFVNGRFATPAKSPASGSLLIHEIAPYFSRLESRREGLWNHDKSS